MLWNWYTVDACFLSSTWHIRSHGAFAGSCIGVIFLVMSLEFLRRAQREFDRYLARRNSIRVPRNDSQSTEDSERGSGKPNTSVTVREANSGDYAARLKVWEHAVRSLLYMLQFAVGYMVMLLAMYYNGTCSSVFDISLELNNWLNSLRLPMPKPFKTTIMLTNIQVTSSS